MYLSYSEKVISDFTYENISSHYSHGFLFTRKSKGNMYQTRSLRIDLSKFSLTSENKRILNKNQTLTLNTEEIPIVNYNWRIHKLAKDFYSIKFGDNTFSASKIKELVTDIEQSNFNRLFIFKNSQNTQEGDSTPEGYALCYANNELLHYAYPFYDLKIPKEQNLGMGMMINAILWALREGKKYVYLGSVVEPASKYKLQFTGLEWWDNDKENWSTDIQHLKQILG